MALGSILGGLAGGVGGIFGAISADKAAKRAEKIQKRQFAETKGFLEPFQQRGVGANTLLDQALGIGFDSPGQRLAASDSFIQNFQDSPLFRLTVQQGLDNANDQILAGNAARGVSNSGATLKALQDRGSEIGNNTILQQLAMLQNTSNQGAGAASSLAGASQNFGNSAADLALQRGNAQAAGFLGAGNTVNSALGNIAFNNALKSSSGFGETDFSRLF